MEKTKKLYSVVLAIIIMFSILPVCNFNISAAGGVQKKINELHNMYPDGYRFQKNYGGGSLCYAFANYVWDYIFGKSIYTDKHFEDVNINNINSTAKIGDYIEFRHRNHACIYLGTCDNGFYAFTSNYEYIGENDVKYNRKYTESGTYRVFHASNYDEIDGSTSTTPEIIDDYYKLTAPDGYQSLRSSASSSAGELARIPTGTVVNVTNYNSDKSWGYLIYNGQSGWIRLYYVQKVSKPVIEVIDDYYELTAPDGYQSLRSSASSSSSELARIPTGTVVNVTNYNSDKSWGYLTYNGQSGWIRLYYVNKTTKPHTHSYGAWSTVTAATCTLAGSRKRVCSCGDAQTETIPETGHMPGDWIIDREAQIGVAGSKHKECTVCHTVLETETIPALEKPVTSGDINGDDKVNNKDLTRLFQYLSNWSVTVNEAALDVNGDGKVNNKDLTRLFQYLSNWDVSIF